MVTKDVLRQYTDLMSEIEEVRKRIKRTEREIQRIEDEGVVVDSVRGGDGGIQHYRIEGFPYPEYQRKRTLLMARKRILENLESELEIMVNDVHEFITTIDDSQIRRIVSLRFIDRLPWWQVAYRMGNVTEGSVKMAFQRFMEKEIDGKQPETELMPSENEEN